MTDAKAINALFDKVQRSLASSREVFNAGENTERAYSILAHARNDAETLAEYMFSLLREEDRLALFRKRRVESRRAQMKLVNPTVEAK